MDTESFSHSVVPDALWNSENLAIVALAMMVALLFGLLVREQVSHARERRESRQREQAAHDRADKAWTLILDVTSKYEAATQRLASLIDDMLDDQA